MSDSAPGATGVPSTPVECGPDPTTVQKSCAHATAQDAAAQAALISAYGQPSATTRVDWVSTPRFYRKDVLIVLYVGCAAEIVQALQATVGTPVATGSTPCNIRG